MCARVRKPCSLGSRNVFYTLPRARARVSITLVGAPAVPTTPIHPPNTLADGMCRLGVGLRPL